MMVHDGSLGVGEPVRPSLVDRSAYSTGHSHHVDLRVQASVRGLCIDRDVSRKVVSLKHSRVCVLEDQVPLTVADKSCSR